MVIPTIVSTITISPNGNSPKTKMIGGMMVDAQRRSVMEVSKHEISRKSISTKKDIKELSSKLPINERYRRLIPYMTFYYANDLVPPPADISSSYNDKVVEVEKAKIIESGTISPNDREPKVIYTQRHKNIPRYQGNRLTQFNIASSNPTKLIYKDVSPTAYQNPYKTKPQNNAFAGHTVFENRDIIYDRYIPQQIKAPSVPFAAPSRKPSFHSYQNEDYLPNVQYISTDQDGSPSYKLVPYEQTPPVKVSNDFSLKPQYNPSNPISKEHVYVKPRPSAHPQPFYISHSAQTKKQPAIVSELYYERRPVSIPVEPVIESGFRPILKSPVLTTETPSYSKTAPESEVPISHYNIDDYKEQELQIVESVPITSEDNKYKTQYVIETSSPPSNRIQDSSNSISLAELLNSLQINKSIPKPITRENISASIRTLLGVLNALKAAPLQNEVETVVVSTPKPFENTETIKPTHVTPATQKPEDFYDEPYLAPVNPPSQHLDDYPTGGGSTQRFPLPVTSDEEGGTPGRPGIDYPILTVIPPTKFDCKTQRYKGFFADPETRCQVWHYCDLNGGQASFLCPNGTIFSQAALTCDWWFNVRCASTTQLYVLNESLYKYILPHSPKFPEDYSGPLVDKYLTLKFKEMEEQFKKNKNKKVASEKIDSDKDDDSNETTEESSTEEISEGDKTQVNQADVIVASSGNSGNVQRLQDE